MKEVLKDNETKALGGSTNNNGDNVKEKDLNLNTCQKGALLLLSFMSFIMKELILKAPKIKASMDFFQITGFWSYAFVLGYIFLSIIEYFFKGFFICFIFISSVYAFSYLFDKDLKQKIKNIINKLIK